MLNILNQAKKSVPAFKNVSLKGLPKKADGDDNVLQTILKQVF